MDCEKCMQSNTTDVRQFMGCGWLPPAPKHLPVMPWSPLAYSTYNEDAPTVCPGYSTKLPEVLETARIRFHWDKGAIRDACGGELATEHTMRGVEILGGTVADLTDWRFKPAKDGGGGS